MCYYQNPNDRVGSSTLKGVDTLLAARVDDIEPVALKV